VKYKVSKVHEPKRGQLLNLRKLAAAPKLIYHYFDIQKNIKSAFCDIAIIYTLTNYQQRDLVACIESQDFVNKFAIPDIRNKSIFLIQSRNFSKRNVNDKLVFLIPSPILFLLIIRIKNLCRGNYRRSRAKSPGLQKIELKDRIILSVLNSFKSLDSFTTISGGRIYPMEFYIPKNLRNYKTHVIHYSQNSVQITYENEPNLFPNNSMVDEESLGDIHWVWTDKYANYLKKFNKNIEFRAVGSIIFKMPELSQGDEKLKLITLFDVAPQQQFNDKNFYDDETALKFISDIVNLKARMPKLKDYSISIKPKRELNRDFHSVNYIEFLERQQLEGKLIIEPWDVNPYTLISKSSLIITIPFSSISYIGLELGTKTVFYYPHSRKLLNLIYEDEIKLITGISELEDYLLGLPLD
jgi:hypothetical protein